MINSNMAPQGMAVTPHHLASESALAVLREGGNAIEAMVAAAATRAKAHELAEFTDFTDVFIPQGHIPTAGERFVQPQLGQTLTALASG